MQDSYIYQVIHLSEDTSESKILGLIHDLNEVRTYNIRLKDLERGI